MQKRLGIKRFSLGSFSESCRVFDPAMLQEVVDQLAGGLLPIDRQALLKDLPGKLTLVDSTVIQTLCTVAEAMFLPLGDGRHTHAWRLHLQFDVDHHVPASWEITRPRTPARAMRRAPSPQTPGRSHLRDGPVVAQFLLWNDIKAAGSSYVCRVRDNSVYEVIEDRPLDQAAIDAGVISDQIVEMGLSKKLDERADHPTRLICINCSPHQKRGKGKRRGVGQTGPTSDGTLRIVTDLTDVPRTSSRSCMSIAGRSRFSSASLSRSWAAGTCSARHRRHPDPDLRRGDLLPDAQHADGQETDQVARDADGLYLQGLASDDDVLRELNKPDNTGIKIAKHKAYFKSIGL